jgi:hypothetical protein
VIRFEKMAGTSMKVASMLKGLQGVGAARAAFSTSQALPLEKRDISYLSDFRKFL